MIHFGALCEVLLFWVLSPSPPQHLGHDKCKCHLWLGTSAAEGQSVSTRRGRKSATLVVMNRYCISSEIIPGKLLSARSTSQHIPSTCFLVSVLDQFGSQAHEKKKKKHKKELMKETKCSELRPP